MNKLKKEEKHINYKIKILELFGGIGAPKKALINLLGEKNIKTIDYVDILSWAVFAYNKMFKNNYLPQSVINWNLNVDILIHGSPCQDFSVAGIGKGGEKNSGTRSSLLWETIDIVKNRLNKLPKVIIWENVKGVLFKKNRHIFDLYLTELKKLGYINKWEILNGLDFGIPQNRKRVFVVSILKGEKQFNNFDFDKLIKIPTKPLSDFLESNVDLEYFIKQPSMIKAIEQGKIKIVKNYVETITTKQMRWNNAGVIKVPISTFTNENLPIFTIDSKKYHLRIITPRESWRLMGFTDEDYNKIAELPKTAKYHLSGNSIIVPVLEAIFKQLMKIKENYNE